MVRQYQSDDYPTRCVQCGYDLRASAVGNCPECGRSVVLAPRAHVPGASLSLRFQNASLFELPALAIRATMRPYHSIGAHADPAITPFAPFVHRAPLATISALIIVTSVILAFGAAVGVVLGVWALRSAGALALYAATNVIMLAYNVLIWALLSTFAALAFIVIGQWPRSCRYVADCAAFLFTYAVAGELARRVVHLTLSCASLYFGGARHTWLVASAAAYVVVAYAIGRSVWRASRPNCAAKLLIVCGTATLVFWAERALWPLWAQMVQRPLLAGVEAWWP